MPLNGSNESDGVGHVRFSVRRLHVVKRHWVTGEVLQWGVQAEDDDDERYYSKGRIAK